MTYPDAFCVKCGNHTSTLDKHTVLLSNSARALKGHCPKCQSMVYRILPKGKKYLSAPELRRHLPDGPRAFCVKCKKETATKDPRAVILENNSLAMSGHCQDCDSEVYRIFGHMDRERLRQAVADKLAERRHEPQAGNIEATGIHAASVHRTRFPVMLAFLSAVTVGFVSGFVTYVYLTGG